VYNMPDDSDSINLINNKFKELLMTVKSQQGSSSQVLSNQPSQNNKINLSNTSSSLSNDIVKEINNINNVHEEIKNSKL